VKKRKETDFFKWESFEKAKTMRNPGKISKSRTFDTEYSDNWKQQRAKTIILYRV